MSEEAEYDLTGQWSGIYNYPAHFPPNSFEAVLRDAAGSLTGTTTEKANLGANIGHTLNAVIDGRREGTSVQFLKMYEDGTDEYDVVQYIGTVEAGGDEIVGTWEVPGVWLGTFLMVRGPGSAASVERRLTEKIEL